MKFKKELGMKKVKVYDQSGRYIETVDRVLYYGFGTNLYCKYDGAFRKVSIAFGEYTIWV